MTAENGTSTTAAAATAKILCHYDILGVERDADASAIKKAHRKLALQYHPDKNLNHDDDDSDAAVERFRLVQRAYECLSDPSERKWYDEHRDAILRGWSAGSGADDHDKNDMLFDVMPYMYAGCYRGYDDGEGGFFAVYRHVFEQIYENEQQQQSGANDKNNDRNDWLPRDFGDSQTAWEDNDNDDGGGVGVASFYQAWESFTSRLNYAWADAYFDVRDAPNRRVRRAMEEENKKARRAAKRARGDEILALVRFVKRRDPRVRARRELEETKRAEALRERQERSAAEKIERQKAREEWKLRAEADVAEAEEQDRLAGRVRLADLEDDYEYAAGKKGKKKNKRKSKSKQWKSQDHEEDENDDNAENASETGDAEAREDQGEQQDGGAVVENSANDAEDAAAADTAPELVDVECEEVVEEEEEQRQQVFLWRCEYCRKDFKSEGQMENHMKSKKHKETVKKMEKKKKK